MNITAASRFFFCYTQVHAPGVLVHPLSVGPRRVHWGLGRFDLASSCPKDHLFSLLLPVFKIKIRARNSSVFSLAQYATCWQLQLLK